MRRVIREEAFNQKWMDEAVTPIDEYFQKGTNTSFEDVRTHRHVVEGYAPVPADPGRAFVPRRARLAQGDFEDHGYTKDCRGCELLQTGIGARKSHSDECRARIEEELAKTEDGKFRLGKSRDRIDHWVAKSGEEIIDSGQHGATDHKDGEDRCKLHGEMSNEAKTNNDGMELDNSEGRDPERFDISGSPDKPMEETVALASRAVAPTERRLRTPERAQAQKRRSTGAVRESVQKRLVMTPGDVMDADDGEHNAGQEENNDMQFEEDSRPSGPGGAGGEDDPDAMIGLFTSLNIIGITEVFSPPRVVLQGKRLGLRAGSSMDLLTGWNFELKADRDRAIQMIEEEDPMLGIGSPPCTYISMQMEKICLT